MRFGKENYNILNNHCDVIERFSYNISTCGSVSLWHSAKPYGLTFGWSVWTESFVEKKKFSKIVIVV